MRNARIALRDISWPISATIAYEDGLGTDFICRAQEELYDDICNQVEELRPALKAYGDVEEGDLYYVPIRILKADGIPFTVFSQ